MVRLPIASVSTAQQATEPLYLGARTLRGVFLAVFSCTVSQSAGSSFLIALRSRSRSQVIITRTNCCSIACATIQSDRRVGNPAYAASPRKLNMMRARQVPFVPRPRPPYTPLHIKHASLWPHGYFLRSPAAMIANSAPPPPTLPSGSA